MPNVSDLGPGVESNALSVFGRSERKKCSLTFVVVDTFDLTSDPGESL